MCSGLVSPELLYAQAQQPPDRWIVAQTLDARCLRIQAWLPNRQQLLCCRVPEIPQYRKFRKMGEACRGDVLTVNSRLILGSPCCGSLCVAKAITTASQQIVAWESPHPAAGALINNSSRGFGCSCPHCLHCDILCSACLSAPKDPTSDSHQIPVLPTDHVLYP